MWPNPKSPGRSAKSYAFVFQKNKNSLLKGIIFTGTNANLESK